MSGRIYEEKIESKLIEDLEANGYEYVELEGEDDLFDNFRKQINFLNRDKDSLDGKKMTDSEFERLKIMTLNRSVFETAEKLRGPLELELDTGKVIYVKLFEKDDWCQNVFQVTKQISVKEKYKNRYDVILLINGLPLVLIELKKTDIEISEAFNQIYRYKNETLNKNLMRYIQFFVISNGSDTKYFCNNEKINVKHTFHWTDENNKRVNKISEIATYMLSKCWVAKLISRYMVLEKTTRTIKIMRPYQIYAVEALIERATTTKNNGYVWHTTGSGKTLTSFKLSQLLKSNKDIERIFFLVDRKDLDNQTIEEFKKFDAGSVDRTDNVDNLIEKLKSKSNSDKLILATIQKMNIVCKNAKNHSLLKQFEDKKVIFIIDECHRTQFGDMHNRIKKIFKEAQWFGFTGTPILQENKTNSDRVTKDVFEKNLHSYLIKDAINDQNVLGFSIDYIKTFNATTDEELRDEEIEAIDTKAVIMDDERINMIAKHIVDVYAKKTYGGKYNAMLACSSVDMAIKYYDAFKKINHDLKITTIFSNVANEEPRDDEKLSKHRLDEIIQDYYGMFSGNTSDYEFSAYFTHVSKKFKQREIDLLIVVNMFLTGYDAPRMNTLFVDKRLKHHNLIQAFSRTNRVLDATKPFGNIVCYQTSKKAVDDAIKTFSKTDNVDIVLMKSFETYLENFNSKVEELKSIYPESDLIEIGDGSLDDHIQFVRIFKELIKEHNNLKTFIEFDFNTDVIGLNEKEYDEFTGKYKNIKETIDKNGEKYKTSILADIDFNIELIQNDKINTQYIYDMLKNEFSDPMQIHREKIQASIDKFLNETSDEVLKSKAKLIREFVKNYNPEHNENYDFEYDFNVFQEEYHKKELYKMSEEFGLPIDFLVEHIERYNYSGKTELTVIKDQLSSDVVMKYKEKNNIDIRPAAKLKLAEEVVEYIKNNTLKK